MSLSNKFYKYIVDLCRMENDCDVIEGRGLSTSLMSTWVQVSLRRMGNKEYKLYKYSRESPSQYGEQPLHWQQSFLFYEHLSPEADWSYQRSVWSH